MKLNESDVQRLYQKMTARHGSMDCLGEEALMRVACGEADREERERVVAHVARCSDCAREYQVARGLMPLRKPKVEQTNPIVLPLAAALALAVAGLGWMFALQQRNATTAAVQPAPVVRKVVQPPVAQVGMPIVDVDADPTRGEASAAATVALPKGVDRYTLIVHVPFDGPGSVLVDNADPIDLNVTAASFTLTLPRAVAGPGKHTLFVRSKGKQLNIPFVVTDQ